MHSGKRWPLWCTIRVRNWRICPSARQGEDENRQTDAVALNWQRRVRKALLSVLCCWWRLLNMEEEQIIVPSYPLIFLHCPPPHAKSLVVIWYVTIQYLHRPRREALMMDTVMMHCKIRCNWPSRSFNMPSELVTGDAAQVFSHRTYSSSSAYIERNGNAPSKYKLTGVK